ncbi:MAG: lipoprotein-releasing ABC transporter permease subunit [Alphaproteobacteria bacterium]|jgi:lipoprotein-releasing system permease protein|nr:lipoprotein-releasing ABC transporter permease subunit [Alphaproteobacteria bacterium]
MLLEWDIAKKYLKSKRKESFIAFISWFSLIGITLGVAVLIIVMSVMNGFRKEIISNLIGANGHIFIVESGGVVSDYQKIINSLQGITEITNIAPSISSQAMISSEGASSGVSVEGLTFKDLSQRDILYKSLANQNLKEFKNNGQVAIVGRVVARDLAINVGDNITLVSANGYTTILGSMPKFAGFKVVGILDTGMYQYDSTMVIVPFSVAQDFFNFAPNTTQKIDIFIKNPQDTRAVASKIYASNSNINYIQDWQSTNRYLMNALDVERNVMFLILSLVILIAAFNIVSGLIMLVRSKTKEIAILRTIGLSKKSIYMVFLFIGIRIGVIGTIWGGLVGVLFSLNIERIRSVLESIMGVNLFAEEIYFLSTLPSDVQSMQVFLVILISLVFAIASSIYPAMRASKIKPVEGLRYE